MMNDIELAALTELVGTERFCMEAANQYRMNCGSALAYGDDVIWTNRDKLSKELERRNI